MAKVKQLSDGTLLYRCPCGDTHAINANRWAFNGDIERPTFSPSVLVTTGHFVPKERSDGSCWCTYNAEHPGELVFGCYLCHSFVRDGMVQFLGDCSHALAGQVVPLGDWS
jgi:Family of unknown function (DUF6527)